jgi:hypothetical protein
MLHLGPNRVEEDGGVIRVEGAAKARLAAPQRREESGDRGDVEKAVQRLIHIKKASTEFIIQSLKYCRPGQDDKIKMVR